jgi:hypothetical protein
MGFTGPRFNSSVHDKNSVDSSPEESLLDGATETFDFAFGVKLKPARWRYPPE